MAATYSCPFCGDDLDNAHGCDECDSFCCTNCLVDGLCPDCDEEFDDEDEEDDR